VSVQGGHVSGGSGGIYFVDVLERKASILERIFPSIDNGGQLYPASEIVPPGESTSQEGEVDQAEMASSQQIAAAVALRTLGRKVVTIQSGALVDETIEGTPAEGRLLPLDVIVAVDGRTIHTPDQLANAMKGKAPGTLVTFTVDRGGSKKTVTLRTIPASKGSKRGIVGVYLEQAEHFKLPLHVTIDAHGVGGPSAGLAFALEVMQQLGRNVDHGQKIAATGQLFPNGQVGSIGGIEQKTIGAREAGVDAFLVPVGNASTAEKYAHGLRIIPVKNFQQALHALATLSKDQ
jgi:PDZ domain-containing protein